MIRINKLIGKDSIWKYINDPNVYSIELRPSGQKGLKNPNICRVLLKVGNENAEHCNMDFNSVIASIEKHKDRKIPYLSGVLSQRYENYLTATQILKLKKFSDGGYKINIPKYYFSLIEKYGPEYLK